MKLVALLIEVAFGTYCQDDNGAISCTCGHVPIVHLASHRGDLELLGKIRDAQTCDFGVQSAAGNNALFFAAQSPKPLAVSRFLVENGVDKSHANRHGMTPLHALLSQDAAVSDVDEILNTINEYRYYGMSSNALSRPVVQFTVIPNYLKVSIPVYLVGYSPSDYLERNDKFSLVEKDKIKSSLQSPFESVISTVSQKSRDELIASFEERRKKEIEQRQRDFDDLRDEFEQKNVEFESQASQLKNSLEATKKMHQDAQSQVLKLKEEYMAEIERHQVEENSIKTRFDECIVHAAEVARLREIEQADKAKELESVTAQHEANLVKNKFDFDARENEFERRIGDYQAQVANYITQVEDLKIQVREKDLAIVNQKAELEQVQESMTSAAATARADLDERLKACAAKVVTFEIESAAQAEQLTATLSENEKLAAEREIRRRQTEQLSADLTAKISANVACLKMLKELRPDDASSQD